ncbi:NirD/YgiW/YdeI family stress tolerance protein [Herbaspirillum sp. LeCh32-8]|uniref:NirD/YgiW/YdeI family stress tolerance protein n=1 Tax=Herbaspirillum sp. LeCh32-8 TaxID=2821356 RepID=UPI001AE5CB5C|nr:NirD/YgiW/YdeI family stress tolerance protein [Herbaspirillum sp. LeCh32-8]MBP0599318.1 NirD/YgiW/YdeI family stress tolerance protein [Herbaspirillum sp. LeCh32-8]
MTSPLSRIAGAMLLVAAGQAMAQYTGPSSQPAVTDAAHAAKAADKTPVTLEGVLASKIRDEHYMFQDNSGTIEVEIDNKHFPAAPVNEKTRLRLQGEVDKDFAQKATVDVKQVTILH